MLSPNGAGRQLIYEERCLRRHKMEDKRPSALGLALMFLRSKRGWSKKRLAHELKMGDRPAAHSAREARELAELALSIAGRVAGESLRSRVQGYCWAYLGNARRVGNDLEGADEAFTRFSRAPASASVSASGARRRPRRASA
jgi:uncharacterized caspase-like protein